jgi:hypothetical protein
MSQTPIGGTHIPVPESAPGAESVPGAASVAPPPPESTDIAPSGAAAESPDVAASAPVAESPSPGPVPPQWHPATPTSPTSPARAFLTRLAFTPQH